MRISIVISERDIKHLKGCTGYDWGCETTVRVMQKIIRKIERMKL